MVQSGLEDSDLVYVSHYKLAIHFILAMGLICYTLWFALELLVSKEQICINPRLKRFTAWITALLVLQLIYGAFMAGLKAGPAAPTWPSINGMWFPQQSHTFSGKELAGISFLFDNPFMVHFIHRNLAYILTILVLLWWWKAVKASGTALFRKVKWLPLLLVLIQVLLGVWAVLKSPYPGQFIWIAEAHQLVAMLLLLSLFIILYLLRYRLSRF
jgi:cytochrome c oxidase assembly protein subunit 15